MTTFLISWYLDRSMISIISTHLIVTILNSYIITLFLLPFFVLNTPTLLFLLSFPFPFFYPLSRSTSVSMSLSLLLFSFRTIFFLVFPMMRSASIAPSTLHLSRTISRCCQGAYLLRSVRSITSKLFTLCWFFLFYYFTPFWFLLSFLSLLL